MSPLAWAAFLPAAAIGAALRYLVDRAMGERADGALPRGTFVVNASGSMLLGFLTGLALYHGFPATPKMVLGTGFCGAYTTFSTFTFQTVRLVEMGEMGTAFRNCAATLLTCAAAAAAGLALAAR